MFASICRYTNTSAVISHISYIDGDKGILRYRGYPIEELTEATYLESAYLVLYGNLPNRCGTSVICADKLSWVQPI